MDSGSFQVDTITLENVEASGQSIAFRYDIDGYKNTLIFKYSEPLPKFDMAYAASLGVMGLSRYGTVIPRRFDLRKYSSWILPEILTFLRAVLPGAWSEHRYQLGRLDYSTPEFVVDSSRLGSKVHLPLLAIDGADYRRVLVASGSGKDSLLCQALLEKGGIEYEAFMYLHELYGDIEHQREVYKRVPVLSAERQRHIMVIKDDYAPWIRERVNEFEVTEAMLNAGLDKPFRTESGEVFEGSFAMALVQVASGIRVQAFGNEKSADFPNIIDTGTGEEIAHQFCKSMHAESAICGLYEKIFSSIQRVSITKPIHDVEIFRALFFLTDELPYLTNSCNFSKPWCCRCEKCLYVFAGFSAFGNHRKTVTTFGKDVFNDPHTLPVWEDLLGFKGRIAWECVGHPEETQLYFYKCRKSGIAGCALDMFEARVIDPLKARGYGDEGIEHLFDAIEQKYSMIHPNHHHMPEWLANRVLDAMFIEDE
ncbi:hypothetical protein [Streptomyces noursei]|uniref:hypothetical protein n=1 Tax=Streptomyces noursei TaxID=1971 RepID=UPI0016752D6B|nr:hypothetical protein [Streptomyces noursei]MCZ1021149.1 hypothetical protein [Streptomyces noursei]GGX57803.1 hypothetical protein GCM10010341_91970 [Streptomyces noursei]